MQRIVENLCMYQFKKIKIKPTIATKIIGESMNVLGAGR